MAYVGQRTEPGKDISEFLALVLVVVGCQSSSEFTDFFNKPHEGSGNSAFFVSFLIFSSNQFLEFADLHLVKVITPYPMRSANFALSKTVLACATAFL